MPRGSSPPAPPAAATNHPHNPHLDVAITCLWILTPLAATISLVIVCVAMTTSQWLHTEEKMSNPNYNGTGERDYLSKYTVSGLWTLCYTNPGEMDLHCFNIDYFPREEYSPDPNDSTMAIPYAVTKSALFFILATLLVFVGEFCCLFGHFARQRRIFTFISGVLCIISGLLMLIGLVMYISIFKAEIGSKLRPRSQLQPPLFTYRYGFSFLLVVSGFMATEIAGICAVFLYIYWHQKEWVHKQFEHHLHRRKLSASSMLLTADHHNPSSLFPCRRHPHSYQQQQYTSGRPPQLLRASPQRRLYLDHDPRGPDGVECSNSREPSPCRHLALPSFTGSMRDMTSSSYYSFPAPAGMVVDTSTGYHQHYFHHHRGEEECEATPPPIDLRHQHHHQHQQQQQHHHHHLHPHHHGSARELSTSHSSFFPRDATTNTVSTTADINSCGDNDIDDEDYSPSMQHEHEFVTFDLDDHPPLPPVRAVATTTDELSPQQRRKDFGLDALRRTTPV